MDFSSTLLQTCKHSNMQTGLVPTPKALEQNIYNIHFGGPEYTHFQTIITILAVHIALTLLLTHLKLGAF